ncbi:recombinase family protein [Nocardia brasiliensis]|uniref:recombinase family protein n=1 Tax=Nocardia brasiliensis TaxID=37326 RepID=UPI002457639E|nr:recombinase family protein [Nocardia brasiliensis]
MKNLSKFERDRSGGEYLEPAVLFISFAAVPKDPDTRIDRFREIGRQRADQAKLHLVHEVVEMGASASTFKNRIAFQALLNYFDEHREVHHLIVPSVGRLSRSWKHLRLVLEEFKLRNISVVTFDGRIAASGEIEASIGTAMRYLAEPQKRERLSGGTK